MPASRKECMRFQAAVATGLLALAACADAAAQTLPARHGRPVVAVAKIIAKQSGVTLKEP